MDSGQYRARGRTLRTSRLFTLELLRTFYFYILFSVKRPMYTVFTQFMHRGCSLHLVLKWACPLADGQFAFDILFSVHVSGGTMYCNVHCVLYNCTLCTMHFVQWTPIHSIPTTEVGQVMLHREGSARQVVGGSVHRGGPGHPAQGVVCQIGLRRAGSSRLMVRPPPIHHKYTQMQREYKYEYKLMLVSRTVLIGATS